MYLRTSQVTFAAGKALLKRPAQLVFAIDPVPLQVNFPRNWTDEIKCKALKSNR